MISYYFTQIHVILQFMRNQYDVMIGILLIENIPLNLVRFIWGIFLKNGIVCITEFSKIKMWSYLFKIILIIMASKLIFITSFLVVYFPPH